MSHKPSEAHYVEGVHRFWIDEGYVVCRIECSDYYSRQAQNFCGGCKEMDFLLYHPGRRDLWLVEVKDYRFDARPKVGELVCALSRKVRDTLFLLRAASVAAPDEEPAEGVSLRDFSILASEAETLHLAFLLEMGMGGVWTDGGLLANVKNLLVASMRFLDAELICAPITYPHRIGPWRVTSAHGEVSKRVEIRRARKLAEIQEQRRRESPGRTRVEGKRPGGEGLSRGQGGGEGAPVETAPPAAHERGNRQSRGTTQKKETGLTPALSIASLPEGPSAPGSVWRLPAPAVWHVSEKSFILQVLAYHAARFINFCVLTTLCLTESLPFHPAPLNFPAPGSPNPPTGACGSWFCSL